MLVGFCSHGRITSSICGINLLQSIYQSISERVAEWLRRLTRTPKVRTAVGSNPTLDSLVAVRNTSPGRPEPCEGNLVAVAGSCGGLMVKHPWPLLEISLSDFRGLATLNINTYPPTYLRKVEFNSTLHMRNRSIITRQWAPLDLHTSSDGGQGCFSRGK